MARKNVIPVFVPHAGCPHACVFCNQRRISGASEPATAETVRRAAEGWRGGPCDLAFYGGSFTALPDERQEELLGAAQPFLSLHPGNALRLSTRPDAVDDAVIGRLLQYGVKTVELGVQSMDGRVLTLSERGHTPEDAVRAAGLVKDAGLALILQMMTGLPGDTPDTSRYTARKLIDLKPDGVRIYPTVVVRDTALWDMYRRGAYREHTVEDAVSLCAALVPMFQAAGIPVIRLGLNPTEELSAGGAAAGAYHPALGELVFRRIYLERARALLRGAGAFGCAVTLGVPRRRLSLMTGQSRSNIRVLMREFRLERLNVRESENAEIVILDIEKHG